MDNVYVKMEIERGSEISVMYKRQLEDRSAIWKEAKLDQLKPIKTMLRTCSGDNIKPLGIARIKVEYQNHWKKRNILVT